MNSKTKAIRNWIFFFMITLFLSGLTAIPLETEISFLSRCFPPDTGLGKWVDKVLVGIVEMNLKYPFLAYGYDWLAFAHFVLALLFLGPLRDPVRNKWVIEFGIIACLLIIPYAFIMGQARSIPIGWRMIDCSFGVIGLIPLCICLARINELEEERKANSVAGVPETSVHHEKFTYEK